MKLKLEQIRDDLAHIILTSDEGETHTISIFYKRWVEVGVQPHHTVVLFGDKEGVDNNQSAGTLFSRATKYRKIKGALEE
jgi:hypothetical protein